MSWDLYAVRGFADKNGFNASQIDDCLKIGLYPALLLKPEYSNQNNVNYICDYVKSKKTSGEPLKMTAHVNADLSSLKSKQITKVCEIENCIDFVHKINKKLGEIFIKEVDVHAGSLHTIKEEYKIRKNALENGISYDNIDATFTAEEYLAGMKNIKSKVSHLCKYSKDRNLELLIENVSQVNFATLEFYDLFNKQKNMDYNIEEYQKKDVRHGPSRWIPNRLQEGDFGCYKDLNYITQGGVCMDIEHIDQTVEYSKEYNFKTRGKKKHITNAQIKLLDKTDMLIEKHKPVIFREEIDTKAFIESLDGRIKESHLVGQVSMFYYDEVKKIGSHMPILFNEDEDPLGIVQDDGLRRRMNEMREKKIKSDLDSLNKAGCRKGVFEIFLGENIYTGSTWKYYNNKSRENVERVLKQCK